MKSLSISKFSKYPSSGVYYCIPTEDGKYWRIFCTTERNVDTGETENPEWELAHAQQYVFVVEYFQKNFNVDISDIGRRCLPRGRILDQKEHKNVWIVLHGDDTPRILNHQIVTEFGLTGLSNIKWQADPYESMEQESKERLVQRCSFMKELFKEKEI